MTWWVRSSHRRKLRSPLALAPPFAYNETKTQPQEEEYNMNRQDALEQYLKAMKAGQKSYRSAVVHGKYPYPQVLDEILD